MSRTGERKWVLIFWNQFSFPAEAGLSQAWPGQAPIFFSPLITGFHQIALLACPAGPSHGPKAGTRFSFPAQKVTFPGI